MRRQIPLRLEPETINQLKQIKTMKGISINKYVENALLKQLRIDIQFEKDIENVLATTWKECPYCGEETIGLYRLRQEGELKCLKCGRMVTVRAIAEKISPRKKPLDI